MARDTGYSLDEPEDFGKTVADLIGTDNKSYAELVEVREENALLKREIIQDLGVYRDYLRSQLKEDR